MTGLPRLIAFYLPQFHPIPENDGWWGRGFTEWTNVTRTAPRFRGHYQPHLPADLGFYDLRLPEAREAQAALAREFGIHGFCYYHYWFNGRRILERPFTEVLASGSPDLPFCVCWANENWTRGWDGSGKVLLEQTYEDDDDRHHVRSLAPALRDERYIRVKDRPLVLIYRASRMPDPARAVGVWRDEARRAGVGEIYLCNVECASSEHGLAPKAGFDAGVEFAPDWTILDEPRRRNALWRAAAAVGLSPRAYAENRVHDYAEMARRMLAKPTPSYVRFPCVTPCWDNSARRRTNALIIDGSTPELYERWLRDAIRTFRPPSADENLVFVNGWNEWAEGNHLEPCQRWGRGYLEATRAAIGGPAVSRPVPAA